MGVSHVERFHDGDWIHVPSVDINGTTAVVTGRWLKTAAIDAEECTEAELPEPPGFIAALQQERSHGFRADVFTFAQKLPRTERRYPYPMEYDRVAAIRLTTFEDWWNRLPRDIRYNVRRAAKRGVEVKLMTLDDEIVKGIVEINNETPVRQGRRFTHYGEAFDRVKTDFLSFSNRSDLLCAYVGQELIGVLKIVYCGEIAAIMKLQTRISHANERPADALIAAALERCCGGRYTFATYGLFRYGNQAWTSLMDFKARHRFEEILVPRYYVPLSRKGRISSFLKLHRGIVGLLPPPVLQAARSFRARTMHKLAGNSR